MGLLSGAGRVGADPLVAVVGPDQEAGLGMARAAKVALPCS